ncbi:MAG: RNA polymerase sigma factor, partial [Lachnospiraceae bacterium]|nr:RNA polymerase sigma factor [Lachnospiraceae bacterium]
LRVSGDEQTAAEVENDGYMETWTRIPPHEPRTYLFAFVGRIVRHLAIDRQRHDTRAKRAAELCELSDELLECLPGDNNVTAEAELSELTALVNAFLATVSPEQRNLFVRRYWFCDSIEEICSRYDLPQSKVKTTLFRLREKLKKQLVLGGYTV